MLLVGQRLHISHDHHLIRSWGISHEKRFDVDEVFYHCCVKKLLVGYLVPTLSRCKKSKNLLPSTEYPAGLLHAIQGRYTDGSSPCRTFGSLGVACFYHQRLRPDEHD